MKTLKFVKERNFSPFASRSVFFLWLMWVLWLPFLAPAIIHLFLVYRPPLQLVLTLVGGTIFLAIYLGTGWYVVRRLITSNLSATPLVLTWLPIVPLTLLSIILSLYSGSDWLTLFIFASASTGGLLYKREVVLAITFLVFLVVVISVLTAAVWTNIVSTALLVAIVGVMTMSWTRAIIANRELQWAREEIARLAVAEERLRIARDLHDLLGHNLSLITLKSELAGRLVTVDPERALSEIRDIEDTARGALREAREAIAGYRQPTLAAELQGVQEMLSAAGIACSCEMIELSLPASVEAILAWVVREGVTNIIRHSRAKQCTICVTHVGGNISITVTDDGQSTLGDQLVVERNSRSGLAGLAERVMAYGGQLQVGPCPGGGFRLYATLPLMRGKDAASI
jgi:two-component system, NarL family, sensor histidine kinase DesK